MGHNSRITRVNETTSSVDIETEARIQQATESMLRERFFNGVMYVGAILVIARND